MKKTLLLTASLFLMPVVAFAQAGDNDDVQRTIFDLFAIIQTIINLVIPLLISAAVIVLLWGILTLIFNAHSDEKRKKAKDVIMTGIIGIFVMVSIWGLINIFLRTLNLDTSTPGGAIQELVNVPAGGFNPLGNCRIGYYYGGKCNKCEQGCKLSANGSECSPDDESDHPRSSCNPPIEIDG